MSRRCRRCATARGDPEHLRSRSPSFWRETATSGDNAGEHDPRAPDLYEILRLSPHADSEGVERVYRTLAKRLHPDNLTTGDAEAFLQRAWPMLTGFSPIQTSVLATTPNGNKPKPRPDSNCSRASFSQGCAASKTGVSLPSACFIESASAITSFPA